MTDEQRDALNMCHNKFVGHDGVKRTVEKLLKLPIDWEHIYFILGTTHFQVLNIDFIGPFHDSSHVLVIICAFTRWTELFWCTDNTAKSATDCLLQHFGRYGAPQMTRSDRGSHFANDLMKQFLVSTGIHHNHSCITLTASINIRIVYRSYNKF